MISLGSSHPFHFILYFSTPFIFFFHSFTYVPYLISSTPRRIVLLTQIPFQHYDSSSFFIIIFHLLFRRQIVKYYTLFLCSFFIHACECEYLLSFLFGIFAGSTGIFNKVQLKCDLKDCFLR